MDANQPTSLTLMDRIRARDQDAWSRLVGLYSPLVKFWCRHWGIDGQDAEDICQEVFLAVSTSLVSFQRDKPGESFRGWLRGITRHKLLDLQRRRRNAPQGQGGTDAQLRFLQVAEPDFELPDGPRDEIASLYRRAVALLQSDFERPTWQAFWLCVVEQRSAGEVATELGLTPAAVRKAKSRVLHRLREELGDLID